MTSEHDPSVEEAVAELKALVRSRYPDAEFSLGRGEDDPSEIHVYATVDVPDTDEVVDLVIDRVLDLQMKQGLPIHVIPLQTRSRIVLGIEEQRARLAVRRGLPAS
jgi:hypothetical protein